MSVFRRIMLSGTNIESRKIYYIATERVVPKTGTIGVVMSNVWDSSTNEGVIICLSDITSIGNSAFGSRFSLISITLPEGVTTIGETAFYKCHSLTDITIPESVINIKPNAFNNCISLTSITIPDGVTSIEFRTFYECTSLTSITIPGSVTSIADDAFYDCTAMQFYNFSQHSVVPTISSETVFTNIPNTCKIIVPDALYDDWIVAENWSTYADHIVKASEYTETQEA